MEVQDLRAVNILRKGHAERSKEDLDYLAATLRPIPFFRDVVANHGETVFRDLLRKCYHE